MTQLTVTIEDSANIADIMTAIEMIRGVASVNIKTEE